MEVLKHPQHKPSTDLCTIPAEIHPVGALTGEPIPTDPHSLLCQLQTFDLQPLIINPLFIDQVGGHKIPQIVTPVDNNTPPVVSPPVVSLARITSPCPPSQCSSDTHFYIS